MKTVKDKLHKDQTEQTYSLTGLTVKELKSICAGLQVVWERNGSNQLKLMIADINTVALKDHVDKLDNVDFETIKQQNRATMKAINKLMPIAGEPHPIPASLQGKLFK